MKIVVFTVLGLVLTVLFGPTLLRGLSTAFRPTETLLVATESGELNELELVTLLGFDAIPAILTPDFVPAVEAARWMDPDEQVLGVSIDGDHRAYSVPMLSRHEIVNDVVGDVPIAVTW